MEKEKKNGWFKKIETRDDALSMVKDTSTGFFVVAGIFAAISFVLGFALLIDAVLYAVGGFFLRRYNSRAAAVVLLIVASVGAAVTFANLAGADLGGGNNIVVAVIIFWAAIRAVEATYKLRSRFSAESVVGEIPRT